MHQTITRRTFLALSVGAGAAALSGSRRARADAPSVGRARVPAGGRSEEQISVGGSQRGSAGFMSVAESIGLWVTANGCSPAPESGAVGSARRETYTGGRDGTEVTLWTIDGGGHGWPKTAGRENAASSPAGIPSSALIWEFFAAHPRGTVSRPS